jgi:hypothetical protein
VSSPRVRVPSRRKAMTVAVTGAATPVGDHIVRALLARSVRGGARSAQWSGSMPSVVRPTACTGDWSTSALPIWQIPARHRRPDPHGGQHRLSQRISGWAPGSGVSARSGRCQTVVISAAARWCRATRRGHQRHDVWRVPGQRGPVARGRPLGPPTPTRDRLVTCWPSSRSCRLPPRSIRAWPSRWCGRRLWSVPASTQSPPDTSRPLVC